MGFLLERSHPVRNWGLGVLGIFVQRVGRLQDLPVHFRDIIPVKENPKFPADEESLNTLPAEPFRAIPFWEDFLALQL